MALGGNVLRQHVVEFIRGTGIVTDGVVDATSLNGPWNWQVPDGVAELTMDACAGGQSGQGGAPVTGGITSAGAGRAGTVGASLRDARVCVVPGSLLTVTLGAGGSATAAGQRGVSGGDTSVTGLLGANFATAADNSIQLAGGSSWQGADPTAVSSGQGLGGGGVTGNGADYISSIIATSPTGGIINGGRDNGISPQGGAGATSGSVAGFRGATLQNFSEPFGRPLRLADNTSAAGTTDGTVSRGGGGLGVPSFFGRGGLGGSNGPGQDSPSYGAGGGGGAGGFGGGAGGDGYVRFTYWSME